MSGQGPPLRGSEKLNNRLKITQPMRGSTGIQTQVLKSCLLCGVGVGQQGLLHASQMLYHWTTAPSWGKGVRETFYMSSSLP